jgi:MFS family permease
VPDTTLTSDQPSSFRTYALSVLVVVYTFNFIDRQILSILLEPIKLDLGLSDTELGLLTGFAFALFYATLGIPIAAALAIWSAMTALSGLALNFWHLLIARIGVGVGEAGCSPPAHAMIADYYPAQQRASALGIYSLGIPVGILFGFVAGGWMNEFFGWRAAFFVVGLPGLLLALVVRFTVREPARGMAEGRADDTEPPTVKETFAMLWSKRAFRHMAFGGALTAFVGYGVVNWVPAFFIRSHGMNTGEIGTWLGLILGIPGGIGIAWGGFLADRLGARDTRWYLRLVAVALVLAAPFSLGVYLLPDPHWALVCLLVPVMLGNFYQATTFSQTQGLVELRMRAVAAAVLLFVLNIIGLGLGPFFVGFLSQLLSPSLGNESLRYALLVAGAFNLWAAWHYWLGGKHLANDLVR